MIRGSKLTGWFAAVLLFAVYSLTAPQNHSEAEDVYDFALQVEQGTFADQAGVNRVLALPLFGVAYKTAQTLGYSGRAFPFMIFINRLLAVICLYLFYRLLSYRRHPAGLAPYRRRPACPDGSGGTDPVDNRLSASNFQLPTALLFAFSYGFWRYANEAETYIMASLLVLGAWNLVLRPSSLVRGQHENESCYNAEPPTSNFQLSTIWCPLISALGIMVHLLNLIPLLLIIPLYYILSKEWKKGVLHGGLTGVLVIAGYAVCSPWLDIGELGAQHHAAEGGITFSNLLRGGIAFGQNLISANFLFGFESFRELLANLFPSRMLDEEFYMAQHMPGWVPWAGVATLSLVGVLGCGKAALECGGSTPLLNHHEEAHGAAEKKGAVLSRQSSVFGNQSSVISPLTISCLAWLLLYALAVIRTEAGSPELWIMALIPFWLLVGLLLAGEPPAIRTAGREQYRLTSAKNERGTGDRSSQKSEDGEPRTKDDAQRTRLSAVGCLLIAFLFLHNLIAGLLPVMSEESDYHAQKAAWLLEHATEEDLILTSYEPILIFYMNYYCSAALINSSEVSVELMKDELGKCSGNTYAFHTFFQPLESMQVRSPEMYDRMQQTGTQLFPMFGKLVENEFGGIWKWTESISVGE